MTPLALFFGERDCKSNYSICKNVICSNAAQMKEIRCFCHDGRSCAIFVAAAGMFRQVLWCNYALSIATIPLYNLKSTSIIINVIQPC